MVCDSLMHPIFSATAVRCCNSGTLNGRCNPQQPAVDYTVTCAKLFPNLVNSSCYCGTNCVGTVVRNSSCQAPGACTCSSPCVFTPTPAPTKAPTKTPTKAPTTSPTTAPSVAPTTSPTTSPTGAPTPLTDEPTIES